MLGKGSFGEQLANAIRKTRGLASIFFLALSLTMPVGAYTLEYRDSFGAAPRRWLANSITIALSTSLQSPPANVKVGSDVVGAAHRALQHWAEAANLRFIETASPAQSISPQKVGSGVSLITVSADNATAFGSSDSPGRTRVFYDPTGRYIIEADIALNPSQPFSSDGTPGTYDLESTFTHEIGHLLGLEHSAVIGSTMQPRQAKNGVYGLPALTQRTLSEDDRAAVAALYGSRTETGSIFGKLLASDVAPGQQQGVFGGHVFAESAVSGKLVAGSLTLPTGDYRLSALAPGEYRLIGQSLNGPITPTDIATFGGSYSGFTGTTPLFRTFDAAGSLSNSTISVSANSTAAQGFFVPTDLAPSLKPQVIGLNGELSTVALPLEAGKTFTVYVGGDGVDQVPATGFSVSSPFMRVNGASLAPQQFGTAYPVVSFDVAVAPNAQAGDYSIRLQSASGETAYLAGALTIDPGVNSSAFSNAIDDPSFFVRQNYSDFLGREPDPVGLSYWTGQLTQCGNHADCLSARRITVSEAFFAAPEFQNTGSFVYRVYKSGLGRRPTFAEFNADRGQVIGGASLESRKETFAITFVGRPEFLQRYPQTMTAQQFTDALLSAIYQNSGADLSARRDSLIALYDGGNSGRAAIVRQVAEDSAFVQAEYNPAFVLMQYFGYLRRDADQGGYDFWLSVLNQNRPNDSGSYHAMVCGFITSTEYQLRFGVATTHTNGECGQ